MIKETTKQVDFFYMIVPMWLGVMMGQRVLHAAWAYERARGVILDTFSS
jgi:hypothetical protein